MLTGTISRFAVVFWNTRTTYIVAPSFMNVKRSVKLFSNMTSSSSCETLKRTAVEALKDVVVQGNKGSDGGAEELHLSFDQAKIDSMTVHELRTALRGFGISAKGLKRELVSTLKLYMDKKTQPMHGDGLDQSPADEKVDAVTVFSNKRKSDQAYEVADDEAVDTCTEVSENGKTKRRGKQSITKKNIKEVEETLTTKKQVLQLPEKIEPWTILAHKKPKPEWVAYNPKTMRPHLPANGVKTTKLLSWNVNGLRALLKIKGLTTLAQEDFDVLCLQETKLQEKDVELIKHSLAEGYENSYWTCSIAKLGYSGTAIISRIKPISVTYGLGVSDHDNEGRIVTAEFDTFYLICAYVPNSGDGLRRLSYRIAEWDTSLSNYMKELEKSKPVILTGDLNCAHQEIDIYDPAGNKRSAGFTNEERQSFELNYLNKGFVDTFRNQYPGVVGYTYWGYRHGGRKTNKGWRLDYFLVSESIAEKVHDSYILPNVLGSDHSPIGLILKN